MAQLSRRLCRSFRRRPTHGGKYFTITTNRGKTLFTITMRIHSTSAIASLMLASQLTVTGSSQAAPAQFQKKEVFFCGSLGTVILRSNRRVNMASGHATFDAQLEIKDRKKIYPGVLHIQMGENDRTFTRRATDDFAQYDATTPSNPVMMSIRVGPYFYSKKREEITIALLREAYTCIPR